MRSQAPYLLQISRISLSIVFHQLIIDGKMLYKAHARAGGGWYQLNEFIAMKTKQ